MKTPGRITINKDVCGGRPCIRGLRMRVSDVLEMPAEKTPREEILKDFPYLQPEDIDACLEFAALQANHSILNAV